MDEYSLDVLQRHHARQRETAEAERLAALARLRAALHEVLPGESAYVFGSVLRAQRFCADSDVDVALLAEPAGQSIFQVQARLEELMDRPVDVLFLHETRLRGKILQEGELWTS